MGTYFLGIDLGTSGIKAGIVDETGAIISDLYWDTDLTAAVAVDGQMGGVIGIDKGFSLISKFGNFQGPAGEQETRYGTKSRPTSSGFPMRASENISSPCGDAQSSLTY